MNMMRFKPLAGLMLAATLAGAPLAGAYAQDAAAPVAAAPAAEAAAPTTEVPAAEAAPAAAPAEHK